MFEKESFIVQNIQFIPKKSSKMSSRNDTNLSQSSRCSMSGSYGRKLRYRTILEDLSTLEDDASNNMECMNKTSQAVKEAKILHREGDIEERVKHPGESYLDSRVLRAASDLTVRCSEAVSGNVNTYDRHELARHIAENPDFWHFPFPGEIPAAAHVFGTFTPVVQRAPRARKQVDKQQAQLKEPEKVDKLQKQEEGSAMVTRVNKFITKWYRQHQQPLSYFHTVLDPDSFSKSVENIYHVSFLVRDGHISVTLDEEFGLPFITPLSHTQKEQADLSDEKQFIVSIDMQRWQDLVSAFGIQKPMMVLKNK